MGNFLQQASHLFRRTGASHRDSLLEVGRLLHKHVLEFVRGGDGMTEYGRMKRELTRRTAVAAACSELRTDVRRVNGLIATAMAVDLLSDGAALGDLRYDVLWNFGRFVRRRRGKRASGSRAGERKPSDVERWVVKQPEARALFARAVSEQWDTATARVELREFGGRSLGAVRAAAGAAAVGDLAELVFDAIKSAESPVAVARKLLAIAEEHEYRQQRRARCG